MLKQKLQQKLLQKLSPQQIQMIKLLEIPTLQIEQRIKKELEENPALEEGPEEEEDITSMDADDELYEDNDKDQEEFTLDDYIEEDDIPEYRLHANNYSKEDEKRNEIPFSVGSTFQEHLKAQLNLRELTEKQKVLGEYILGNIDEDGYLRRELENIVDDLAFLQNVTTDEKELEEVLEVIQDLDPPGVGARTLRECLLIQLAIKDRTEDSLKMAYTVIDLYFDEFSKRHYDKITSKMGITESELKAAIDEILKLNPKPGSLFSDSISRTSQPIIPDFILEHTEEGFDLHLNSKNLPELRLNSAYNEMLKSYVRDKSQKKEMKEAVMFVKQKIDSARWFIDAIKQRQNTLLLTMNAILKYQEEYFIDGDEVKAQAHDPQGCC